MVDADTAMEAALLCLKMHGAKAVSCNFFKPARLHMLMDVRRGAPQEAGAFFRRRCFTHSARFLVILGEGEGEGGWGLGGTAAHRCLNKEIPACFMGALAFISLQRKGLIHLALYKSCG
jgi:hypothetical protein